MIVKSLKLKNFYSHKDTEIIFDKDIYIILGQIKDTNKSNGSGKSSICRAICYALYGDSTDSERNTRSLQVKGDALIYNDEKEMEVTLDFEINEEDYQIRRTLKRGTTASIYISKNGGEAIKYGIKDAQETIETIIGANYEIFKNTSYFQQGDLNSFSKLTPKTAKDIVMSILQLDIYNKYEQTTKDNILVIKNKIQELEVRERNITDFIEKQREEIKDSKYTNKDLKEIEIILRELKFKKQMQAFLENSKNKSIESLDEIITTRQKDLSKIESEIDLVKRRIIKLEKLKGSKTCPTCEQNLEEEDIKVIVQTLHKDLDKRQPKMDIATKELRHYNKERKELKEQAIEIYDENKFIEAKEKYTEIKLELKKAQSDDSKLKNTEKELQKIKKEIKEQKDLLSQYNVLKEAFGRNGIPAYIIENIIPEIEETANDILKGLDTKLRISIESQKDLKSGGKAETLDINVITEYGERAYANYSGGEKTFIDFAVRMALSIILARRSNYQIQTLILDEAWEHLDGVNRSLISKAIKWIKNKFDFKRIIIISHQEELQDICDNVIKIIFNGKKSYVQT